MWLEPIELKRQTVTLVPLHQDHASDLAAAVADRDLHKLWYTNVPEPEGVPAEINRRLTLLAQGSMVPFAVVDGSGTAVGMTTFMNIDAAHRRVEIGSTWYRKSTQRTGLNTLCRALMLRHVFEDKGAIAVEFRTHVMNRQSRQAIERLGAKLDGVLRSHMVMANGTLRDTAVYSIVAAEWPAVRANLKHLLHA